MNETWGKNVLYYGRGAPLPGRRLLRAGPLTMVYEAGDLRYIRLGEHEILRRIYVAVRDRNWGTVPGLLSNEQIETTENSFRITYEARCRQGEIDFRWRGTIVGDAGGRLRFTMRGRAHASFLRNRIGFCVLHPMRPCAGAPCMVERTDGTVASGTFPDYIASHQPFVDIRALSHQVLPGLWAEVRCEGDVFEMEDQRNWTDASFKTYSTPLALPFPARVAAETEIDQAVELILKGDVPADAAVVSGGEVTVSVGRHAAVSLPRLGLGVASHSRPLEEQAIARLRALHPAHLRLDLDLANWAAGGKAALYRAAEEARAVGAALEVALFLSGAAQEELALLSAELERLRPPVCTWLIFHQGEKATSAGWVDLTRRYLQGAIPSARFGGGSNAYFAELNRARPATDGLDLVAYPITPQVHAFDNASLVETLAAQAETVRSARRFVGCLPIAISPITLNPRFNPDATGTTRDPLPGKLPAPVDVRQMSLLGAGWTVGSLKYLAECGVYSLTYYETTGWRGVMATERGSPLPERFFSLPGMVYPIYHVLADVGAWAGAAVLPTRSSRPLEVEALALCREGRVRLLLANLTAERRSVRVCGVGSKVQVRVLDETSVEQAMVEPEAFRARPGSVIRAKGRHLSLDLLPFAIVRIDGDRRDIV